MRDVQAEHPHDLHPAEADHDLQHDDEPGIDLHQLDEGLHDDDHDLQHDQLPEDQVLPEEHLQGVAVRDLLHEEVIQHEVQQLLRCHLTMDEEPIHVVMVL